MKLATQLGEIVSCYSIRYTVIICPSWAAHFHFYGTPDKMRGFFWKNPVYSKLIIGVKNRNYFPRTDFSLRSHWLTIFVGGQPPGIHKNESKNGVMHWGYTQEGIQ